MTRTQKDEIRALKYKLVVARNAARDLRGHLLSPRVVGDEDVAAGNALDAAVAHLGDAIDELGDLL